MSHEIRTPLNGIIGVFQILERQNLEEDNEKLIKSGKTSSATLLSLLNNILDFSKIESGKIDFEILPTHIPDTLRNCVFEHENSITNKALPIVLTFSNIVNEIRQTDGVRLKQIVGNLLSNAIKFTEKGQINVVVAMHPAHIEIEVNDTGIGISEEALQKLFSRFEQADKSTTRKYGGSGLGMAITKQLTELMGGRIAIESKVNQGTRVQVTIPMAPAEIQDHNETPVDIPAPNLKGCHILIAEDNLINQQIIESLLEPTQGTVHMTNNGQEAIDVFLEVKPDLVLLDIQMPVLDGIGCCKAIRQHDKTVPIIAVSANTYDTDIETYLASGFDAHIPKPINMNEFYTTLDDILDGNE